MGCGQEYEDGLQVVFFEGAFYCAESTGLEGFNGVRY